MVSHVLSCVPAQEWPTRVDAMEAVLRRLESIRRDNLRVEARPAEGRLLGLYITRRSGSGSRPYRTVLLGVDPIEGRCDCPDFLKNSLGLCKHVLVVLEHLHTRPRLLQQATKEQEWSDASLRSGLRWDPLRPLTGIGDWLDRVEWKGDFEAAKARSTRVAQAARWFRSNQDGSASLKNSFPDKPARRLELVEDLLKIVPAGAAGSLHDPALRNLLENERRRLKPIVEQVLGAGEIRDAIKGLKRPLYPYQREGVDRFLAAGRLLLADDMGLGKTAQAIACCNILRHSGRVRRGLIIAPASLKPQWAREWAVFSDLPIHVVDGNPEERQAAYTARKEGFLIINYEQLLRDLEIVRRWDPDLVVLDEAQRIKNWATKTALSVKGLTPRYRLVLTGTPMENRIDELASIVEWVDDMALEPKWRLASLHSIRADGKREVVGARNLDTIRDRLQALHGAPRPPGCARPASVANRHPRSDRNDRSPDGRPRRPEPADRAARPALAQTAADPGRVSQTDEPAHHPADHLQRDGPAPVRKPLADDPGPPSRGRPAPGALRTQVDRAASARAANRARTRAQGRRLQPVAANALAGALGGERPAGRQRPSRRLLHRRPKASAGAPRTSSSSTMIPTFASSSPAMPAESA